MKAASPLRFLILAIGATAVWNTVVVLVEAEHVTAPQVITAVLGPYVGVYFPYPGEPPVPDTWLALGIAFGLLCTFASALGIAIAATRSAWQLWILRFQPSPDLLVAGASDEARQIFESAIADNLRTVWLVRSPSPASEGAITVQRWDTKPPKSLVKLVSSARSIIVADQTDSDSASLAAAIRRLIDQSSAADQSNPVIEGMRSARGPFQLVRANGIIAGIRPPEIWKDLPQIELFQPRETLAQFIVGVLVKYQKLMCATNSRGRTMTYTFVGDDNRLRQLLHEWLENWNAARRLIAETRGLEFRSVEDTKNCDITIYLGDPYEVAAHAATHPRKEGSLAILVAARSVFSIIPWLDDIPDAADWYRDGIKVPPGRLLLVDPDSVGLHHRFITDGVRQLWGRMYHEAYSLMYGGATAPWNFMAPGRNEQGSMQAVVYGIERLGILGFEFVRVGQSGSHPSDVMTDAEAAELAADEHREWLEHRQWIDENGTHPACVQFDPQTGEYRKRPSAVPFEMLDATTRGYNLRVPREVWPALAALLGYRIRRRRSTLCDEADC